MIFKEKYDNKNITLFFSLKTKRNLRIEELAIDESCIKQDIHNTLIFIPFSLLKSKSKNLLEMKKLKI